ncbi:MAG: DMT family transporter [Rhodocyclaceae bacterium]
MTQNEPEAGQTAPAPRSPLWPVAALTALAMLAFASNSLLARMAMLTTSIDAASFTAGRMLTGAVVLAVILGVRGDRPWVSGGGVLSALLLFAYAVTFSYGYRGIDTGAGALVLFASVQLLMVGVGLASGERTNLLGVALALGGLVVFLAPSGSSPPLSAALLMVAAGLAWGGFSLVGRGGGSPVLWTANSFILAAPLSLGLLWLQRHQLEFDSLGLLYAVLSGAVTSALGYVLWYWVRVRMAAITAGTVQLSVPVLSALMGIVVLGESLSAKGALAACVVLLGVALTSWKTRKG